MISHIHCRMKPTCIMSCQISQKTDGMTHLFPIQYSNFKFSSYINMHVCCLNQEEGHSDSSQARCRAINFMRSKLPFMGSYLALYSSSWNEAFMSNHLCKVVTAECQLVSLSHTYLELMMLKKKIPDAHMHTHRANINKNVWLSTILINSYYSFLISQKINFLCHLNNYMPYLDR